MAPFVVTEDRPGVRWQYAEVLGFEVLTQASTEETQLVISALYRGRVLTLPVEWRPKITTPTVVIIFNQPPDRANPTGPVGQIRKSGEAQAHWTNIIKRTMPDRELFALNMWGGRIRYTSVFRYDLATLLALRAPAAPAWLQAGLFGQYGIYFEDVGYREGDDRVRLYRAQWSSSSELKQARALWPKIQEVMKERAGATVLELSAALSRSPLAKEIAAVTQMLVPLEQLWTDSPKYQDPAEQRRWEATCALFTRWAFFADEGKHAASFWRFAAAASSRPVNEALFTTYFGLSYDDLRVRLGGYFPQAANEYPEYPVTAPKLSSVKLRDATAAESGRLLAEWYRGEATALASRMPEVAIRYHEQASRVLERAYARSGSDPELVATFGLYEYDSGHLDHARELLESAQKLSAVRPLAYLRLAQLRFDALTKISSGGGTGLTRQEASEVMDPLMKAAGHSPPLAAVYELMVQVCERGPEKPAREVVAKLVEAGRLFPRQTELLAKIARVLEQHGFTTEAQSVKAMREPFAAAQR